MRRLIFALPSLVLSLTAAAAEPGPLPQPLPVPMPAPQSVPVPAPAPTAADQLTDMVRAAVTTYTLAMSDLGVNRNHPIKIKLSNNANDYETHAGGYVIQYRDVAARWPNGLAYMTDETLMIKAIEPYDQSALQNRVWHAMTHSLQYDLSSGNAARARPWLAEGMADLYTFLAAGQADADSFKQWKSTLYRKLADLDSRLAPAALIDIDQYDWDELSDQSKGANYAVADLMVINLYEANGAKAIPQLAGYFSCLTAGLKAETSCFSETFSVTPEKFIQGIPKLAQR